MQNGRTRSGTAAQAAAGIPDATWMALPRDVGVADPAFRSLHSVWLAAARGALPDSAAFDVEALAPWLGRVAIVRRLDDGELLAELPGCEMHDRRGWRPATARIAPADPSAPAYGAAIDNGVIALLRGSARRGGRVVTWRGMVLPLSDRAALSLHTAA